MKYSENHTDFETLVIFNFITYASVVSTASFGTILAPLFTLSIIMGEFTKI